MDDPKINVAIINQLASANNLVVPRIKPFILKREQKCDREADKTSLFKVPLHIVLDRCPIRKGEMILPRFVVEISERLHDFLGTEGLFRVNGSNARMQILQAAISQGLPIESQVVIHDLTGILKHFLRELPTPLLSHWLYPVFMQAYQLPVADRLRVILLLVLLLPKTHVDMLQYLMALLHDIVAFPGSKMSPSNLAAIFTPNILRPLDVDEKTHKRAKMTTDLELANHTTSVGIVELLIVNYKAIGKVPADISKLAGTYNFEAAAKQWGALRTEPPKRGLFSCCNPPPEEGPALVEPTTPTTPKRNDDRRTSKAALDLIHGHAAKAGGSPGPGQEGGK